MIRLFIKMRETIREVIVNAIRFVKRAWVAMLKITAGLLLTGLLGLIVSDPIIGWWEGPRIYHIYVAGNYSGTDTLAEAVWNGITAIKDSGQGPLQINGIRVRFQQVNDNGSPDEAKRISSELARKDDALLVVGHIQSTQTKEALPNYLAAIPPIPVILTTETNPNLIPAALPDEFLYSPIFRLAPTDDELIKSTVEFLVKRNHKFPLASKGKFPGDSHRAFWVVEDTANPTYSRYVADTLVHEIQEQRAGISVQLRTTNVEMPNPEIVRTLRISGILFAGDWRNALVWIREIQGLWPGRDRPLIVISDWSGDEVMLDKCGDDLEEVLLFHPMPIDMYFKHYQTNGKSRTPDAQRQLWRLGELYGRDAYSIIRLLVTEADAKYDHLAKQSLSRAIAFRRLLKMDRVTDARSVLTDVMTRWVLNSRLVKGEASVYQFAGTGSNIKAAFHPWLIHQCKFVDPDDSPASNVMSQSNRRGVMTP